MKLTVFALAVTLLPLSFASSFSAELSVEVLHGKGFFFIANKDNFEWRDCDFDLNDDYSFKAASVKAYAILQIPSGEFTKRNGERFDPARSKALRLGIYCRGTPTGPMAALVSWR